MSKWTRLGVFWVACTLPVLAAEKFFLSSGIKIRYLDQGRGEVVVLMHGFGGSADDWVRSGVIRALAKEYRVLTIDARGHGRTDKPHEVAKYGLEMVEDVVRLLDHLRIQTAHVIGFSMGSRIAAKLMVIHSDRLQSVVLAGGAARQDTPGARRNLEEVATAFEQGTVIVRT